MEWSTGMFCGRTHFRPGLSEPACAFIMREPGIPTGTKDIPPSLGPICIGAQKALEATKSALAPGFTGSLDL